MPVTVGFFAQAGDKHAYADLKREDLILLDSAKPIQSILSLRKGTELPLRIGFLIDASNSQRNNALYRDAVLTGWDFLQHLLKGSDDKVFVEKVAAEHEASAFMSATEFRSYRLHADTGGGTALYDGIGFACDSRMKNAEPPAARRVLIVLSDGEDNLSDISRDAAIAKALDAGVAIFTVSTADSPDNHPARADSTLEHLAKDTGGEAFLHLNRKKIEQVYATISEVVNNMYFVTFVPAEGSAQGFHRIELKTSGKDKIRFSAPKGYSHR
jgi:VWFA-related protein